MSRRRLAIVLASVMGLGTLVLVIVSVFALFEPPERKLARLLDGTRRVEVSSEARNWQVVELGGREEVAELVSLTVNRLKACPESATGQYGIQARFFLENGNHVTLAFLGDADSRPRRSSLRDFIVQMPGERGFHAFSASTGRLAKRLFEHSMKEELELGTIEEKVGQTQVLFHYVNGSPVVGIVPLRDRPRWTVEIRTTGGNVLPALSQQPSRWWLKDLPREHLAGVNVIVDARVTSFDIPRTRFHEPINARQD